jgi:uncharacterized protein
MDDLGYSLARAERVLALPVPVTLGLLPFAPDTAAIARRARDSGHEVILHQPMEPLTTTRRKPMLPGTLTVDMPEAQFHAYMDAALRAVPGLVGINNHTGSRLTQDRGAMQRLMALLAQRNLMFLDSRTTPATVAYATAREARVPALQRDVFLDHDPHPDAVHAAFQRALDIARARGQAIVIAHPYAISIDYLEQALSQLPDDVNVVSLRTLSDRGRRATLARHEIPETPHRSLGQ